jgi:hypothetical protein
MPAHAEGLSTWEDLHRITTDAVKTFTLRGPVVLEPLRGRSSCRTYGDCSYDHCATCRCPPTIRLRLRGRRGPLSRAAILAVLAHELAHLRHLKHGRAHAALTREIAAWLRDHAGEPTTPHMLVLSPAKRC